MSPPEITAPPAVELTEASQDASLRRLGRSYVRDRGAMREARLVGDPVAIGHAQATLLSGQMERIESALQEQFAELVPGRWTRLLLLDLARFRFRDLDSRMSLPRRREIAAQARAFQPDPFADFMGTYQRFVFLNALYDIMLSFERSPLVGCSSFVLTGEASADGHTLLGRNFDFEGPQVLDDEKVVFLIHEEGRIPFASVSWAGFIGVASGMNREGVAVVIHGARAGEPRSEGEPVAHTVRDLLGGARSTSEALAQLEGRAAMVSHMLLIADGAGDTAIVERVPGHAPHVRRRQAATMPLTNHLEGPHASDPKNQQVRAATSTLPRRERLDELLANVSPGSSVEHAVEILRDKRGAGDVTLPLGHRSAIDGLIATHSVVMDATARTLWVSEGAHATGRFVRFDLRQLLDPSYEPGAPEPLMTIGEDAIVHDGRLEAWRQAGSPHEGAE